MTADQVTTAAEHVGWVEFVTADDAATTHIAYVHEDGSVYLPEGPDVVTWEAFRLTAATDRFWPLVRVADRPAPQVDERAVERAARPCDRCGAPSTHVTTPGGFRFCDKCGSKR